MTPEELRDIRAGAGWTRRQLARAIKVSPRTIEEWEHGRNAIPEPVAELVRIKAAGRRRYLRRSTS